MSILVNFQRDFREKFDLGEPDIPLKLGSPPKDKKQRKRSHGDREEDGPSKKRRKKKRTDEETRSEGVGSKKNKEKVSTIDLNCSVWLGTCPFCEVILLATE